MGQLAAVVLAAGVSSRMGRFKPMLPVDGRTMAQRVVDSMLTAGAYPVVVVTGYQGSCSSRAWYSRGTSAIVRRRCWIPS